MLWFGAVIWNALGVPVWLFVLRGDEDLPMFLTWVMPLFVLTGVLLLSLAVRDTLRWRRFSGLTLELDPFPGSLGGHVGGAVELPLHPSDASELKVTLACVHVTIRKSKDGSSITESVVWSKQMTPTADRVGTGVRAQFTFEIDDDLPQTEEPSDSYHKWTVRVAARLPGADLDQAFEVPVYRTPEPLLAEHEALQEVGAPDRDDFPSHVVRVERRGRGLVLSYPAGREGGMALGMLMMGAVFAGAGVFIAGMSPNISSGTMFGALEALFISLFLVAFGGVGLSLFLAGVYTLINSLEVEIGAGEIIATRRFVFRMRRKVRLDDVSRIEISVHAQSGQGAKSKVFYRIRAMLKDGGRVPLGDGIPGSHLAERIGELVEEQTGMAAEVVVKKKRWKGRRA